MLFLHADVRLPKAAASLIENALSSNRIVGGAFRPWTVPERSAPGWSGLMHLADLRSRYSRYPYGDQALFVRTDVFRRIGGLVEQPLMEDLELARRFSMLL